MKKINTNKIIIKPADKGSITIVMTPKDYWNTWFRHLSDIGFYNNLENNGWYTIAQARVNKIAKKYKFILKNNQYDFLTKRCHKISNFYMLPKLHKLKVINKIIEIKRYRLYWKDWKTIAGWLTDSWAIEGWPVVVGPVSHTSGIGKIILWNLLYP